MVVAHPIARPSKRSAWRVCRMFSASLYGAGNGLVTPGRFGAPWDWFQEVELRAQLVVLEWKIYFQSRAVAKPGIALAWGTVRGKHSPSSEPAPDGHSVHLRRIIW